MHIAIIVAVCLNIALSLAVAEVSRRRYRRGHLHWQRLVAYGALAYAATRVTLIMPPFAPDNDDLSVLTAVLAETVIFLAVIISPTRKG